MKIIRGITLLIISIGLITGVMTIPGAAVAYNNVSSSNVALITLEPTPATVAQTLYGVTTSSTSVRTGAHVNYSVYATMPTGYKMTITGVAGTFYRVTYNNKSGYVSSSDVTLTVNNVKIKGIDVSKWQGTINWSSVKSDGVQFAMLRSSYGSSSVDPMFETNYAAAKANGIEVGAYHYSYATTVAQATKEANFWISKLKGKQFDYPVCVDLEDSSQGTLDTKTLMDIALTYLNMLEQAGYYPMIYANKNWFTSVLDDSMLTSYDHWLAQYASSYTYTGTVGIWQYTSTGTVKGINGSVDMDTSFVDYASQIKALHLNGY